MQYSLNTLWKIVKFLWNVLKHIILLPLYCSMPDKYNGVMYDEWLDENKKDDDVIDAEYTKE